MKKIDDLENEERVKINNLKLQMNLSLFAEGGEKTEEATSKKKQDARKKGQVANSQEVGTALLLLSAFFSLSIFARGIINDINTTFMIAFNMFDNATSPFSVYFATTYVTYLFQRVLLIAAPMLAVSMVLGVTSNLIKVGWKPTTEPMKPKLSKLNPIKGAKKIIGMQAVINLLKALLKFICIMIVLITVISNRIGIMANLPYLTLEQSTLYFGNLVISVGLQVGATFIFIALADLTYTRYKHRKDLRMSKQEVKEEWKQMDGNPQIKGRIRQKMREASMRRMMQDLPSADVIITNPTHYAVALKYDREKFGDAPVVIAKGVDFMAKRIREKATEHGVEIVENVQLARALYAQVEIGKAIPPELFQAVAEILAFVFKMKQEKKDNPFASTGRANEVRTGEL